MLSFHSYGAISRALDLEQDIPSTMDLAEEKITLTAEEEKVVLNYQTQLSKRYEDSPFFSKAWIPIIIQNLSKALANKYIKIEDLKDINILTIRDVFKSHNGNTALQEKLFTLKEMNPIQTSVVEKLLTDKGINFLRETQKEYTFSDLIKLHLSDLFHAIENGYMPKIILKEEEVYEKKVTLKISM